MCKENQKPVDYKVYPYIKDEIGPYQTKVIQYPEEANHCIHFDESDTENKKCQRCEPGYRKNKASSLCIECNSYGKTGDEDDLICIFWSFDTVDKGRCENVQRD